MSSLRRHRSEIFTGAPPLELWPTVLDTILTADQRESFNSRSKALKMYAEGYPVSKIQEVTGIDRSRLSSLATKAMEVASDGRIMGFRALLPYTHSKQYQRSAEIKQRLPEERGGLSGVFRQTLRKFPEIEDQLIQYIKKRNSRVLNVHEKKIRAKDLHRVFIKSLSKAGVGPPHWPFNTKNMGLKTIQKFLNTVLDESFHRAVTMREEQAAIAHLSVGTGHDRFINYELPFDAVEVDAYCINAFFTAKFQTPEGTEANIQLERIWLIALIDVVSSAILSHLVVFRSQVGASDVIGAIKKAVNPPEVVALTLPGLEYPQESGLPAEVFSKCQGALWSNLLMDGALAHLSQAIHAQARPKLGFILNWGPVAHFERRPNIERFFSTISKNIFMRMPSTTGSNPGKGRAKNAEKNAVTYKICIEEVEQLVAVYIAQYNATPNEGSSYNSPLGVINHYLEKPPDHFLLRKLPSRDGSSTIAIPMTRTCIVRGGRSSGRRPYIQLDGVRYTSPVLARSSGLINQKLFVEFDEEDMRFCKAYLSDGGELGSLKANGRWGETRHSRKTRKIILSLITRKILVVTSQTDPVQEYLNFLSTSEKRRRKNKPLLTARQATEATRVAREAGLSQRVLAKAGVGFPTEVSLTQLQKTRPTLMSEPMPDLNKLMKRKK